MKRSIGAVAIFGLLLVLRGFAGLADATQPAAVTDANRAPSLPIEIPIIIVKYFPVDGDRIDIKVTGDWGDSLAATRDKTERITRQTIAALEEGSRYHGYKDANAKPSLKYTVLAVKEFLQPLPVRPKRRRDSVPMTDYARIMADIDGRAWVEQKGA